MRYLKCYNIFESKVDKLTLYHGTTDSSANHMIKNGWQPRERGYGANMGDPKYLYLTNEPENALWFANENGGDVVLEISDIPLEYLKPDPDDYAGYSMQELLDDFNKGEVVNFILTTPLDNNHFKRLT